MKGICFPIDAGRFRFLRIRTQTREGLDAGPCDAIRGRNFARHGTTAPVSVSSLDNGKAATPFASSVRPPELTLDPPQREQQVDLFIGDRLPLDLCEMAWRWAPICSRASGPRARMRHFLIQISISTRWALCWYSTPSNIGCEPAL
jgi:hypothetical protein